MVSGRSCVCRYYLRTKPAAHAIQFTVDKTMLAANATTAEAEGPVCRKAAANDDDDGECLTCSA